MVSSNVHSSPTRFSSGVPDRAIRRDARSRRTTRAVRVEGFFTNWASSRVNVRQCSPSSTAASMRAVP